MANSPVSGMLVTRNDMNMTQEAYLFYEAGQAVAAAHLGLRVHHVHGNTIDNPTSIVIPKKTPKPQMILWLAGMAAERRGVGKSHPLRRMRNRQRIKVLLDAYIDGLTVSKSKKAEARRQIVNQSQDRANAIVVNLFAAISEVAALMRPGQPVEGDKVVEIVDRIKSERRARGEAETPTEE